MPFSKEKTDYFIDAIQERLSSGTANGWETNFLTSMSEKFEKYGTKTTLSEKQYAALLRTLKVSSSDLPNSKQSSSGEDNSPTNRTSSYKPPASRQKPQQQKKIYIRNPVRRLLPWPLRGLVPYRIAVDVGSTSKSSGDGSNAMLVIALIVGAILLFAMFGSGSSNGSRDQITISPATTAPQSVQGGIVTAIIDGDTIRIRGMSRDVRLVGFDTPETFRPQCSRESALGREATSRLVQMVTTAKELEFRELRCACPSSTLGTNDCNFGRACGILKVDGKDVGKRLIAEGLATPFHCGHTSCPRRPRPWCN